MSENNDNNTIPGMTIGKAIESLKEGNRITRIGWNGKGQYLELQTPDQHSKMTLPYIYISTVISTVKSDLVPWLASQTDILANDWIIYGAPKD